MKLLTILILLALTLYAATNNKRLPSNIIGMTPMSQYTSESFALLMDKSRYTLSLYSSKRGEIEKISKYHAIFGKNHGDKFFQGDQKTPEGIYFIQEIKTERNLLPKYGKRALVLNYPNPIDKLNGKTGLGIWIHSVDDPQRLKKLNDTRGCVAIANDDILHLSKIVHLYDTPVIIVREEEFFQAEQRANQRDYFYSLINNWKKAWQNGEINTYISFYSDNFYSTAKKKNKKEWKAYKSYLNKVNNNNILIEVNDINIFNFGKYAVVKFKQSYRSPVLHDTGKKILYLENKDNEYKIVSESWFALQQRPSDTTLTKKD